MKIGVIHPNWQRSECFKECQTLEEAKELALQYTRMFGWAEIIEYETIEEYDREEIRNDR
ncbi:hypothetical protein [Caloramator proteoclasticus]|uniref:Uncharacterized protein n=1 Tax=Caloramator proteoclasticus DSM 10124 TaxID=1121262 RepID=A0A1M4ZGJ6_9CLOT|nr:hypothetical protein [Caloramator proteoclasticus]SHF17159.1 hypothetical protein SAMN02746091_01921 [Caloramator proteoclasticus DSM 10124]